MKLPDGGGVFFANGTKQSLTWKGDKDAPVLYRWCLVIARLEGTGS